MELARKVISIFFLFNLRLTSAQFNQHYDNRAFYDQYKLIRMYTANVFNQNYLYDYLLPRADFWTAPFSNGTVDFMISPRDYEGVVRHLHLQKVPFKVVNNNVQKTINAQMNEVAPDLNVDEIVDRSYTVRRAGNVFSKWFHFLMRPFGPAYSPERSTVFRAPRKIPNKFLKGYKMDWKSYHRLNDIYDYMYFLQQKYPHMAEVIDIGLTVEKRPMLLLKIGSKKFSDKPAIVIEGGIHAREWIAPATATFLMHTLVEKSRQNQDLTDFYDFYILPVANPDGYEYSFTRNRLWRKNRAKNGGLSSLLLSACDGVDLNRNFGFHWQDISTIHIQGGTQLNCAETYSGPAPFSEPETRNIAKFVTSIQQNVVAYLMIHSYGQKILYPWSHSSVRIHDWEDLHGMGQLMASAIERYSGRNYVVGSSPKTQYLAAGGSDDWARGEMGIKWVFLLELPDTGSYGFLLPANMIRPTAQSIFRGIRALAVRVSHTLAY